MGGRLNLDLVDPNWLTDQTIISTTSPVCSTCVVVIVGDAAMTFAGHFYLFILAPVAALEPRRVCALGNG